MSLVKSPNIVNRSILYKLTYKYIEIPISVLRNFHGISQVKELLKPRKVKNMISGLEGWRDTWQDRTVKQYGTDG